MDEFDAFIDYVNAVDDPGEVTVRNAHFTQTTIVVACP
jgi:hypothetical protein